MQTVHSRLTAYCEQHGHSMPYGNHLNDIGYIIAYTFRELYADQEIQKTTVTAEIEVNQYPDEFAPMIDDVIAKYFSNRQNILAMATGRTRTKAKSFTYELHEWEVEPMMKALADLKQTAVPDENYKRREGMVQYRISKMPAATLIKLGKKFQKYRILKKKQVYRERAVVDSDDISRYQPAQVIPEKKPRKRIPKKDSNE